MDSTIQFDAPPAPTGYAHRWIRTTVQGFEDTANVSKKLREGWEFVKEVDQIKEEIGENKYPFYTEGRYEGCIGIGGSLCWQGYQRRY